MMKTQYEELESYFSPQNEEQDSPAAAAAATAAVILPFCSERNWQCIAGNF